MGGGPVNARRQRYQTQDINNNAPPDMSRSSLYPNYQYVPVPPQQFHYYSYYNAPPPPPPQSIHPLPLPPPLPPIPAAYARSRMTIESTSPPPAMAAVETSQQGQPVRLIYTKSGFHVRPSANTNTSINGFLMIVSKGESTELNVYVAWVPEYLVSTEDLTLLIQLDGALASEKGFPCVSVNPGEHESMMIPVTGIHSLYVRPPDVAKEGTIIITTTHGDILRPLLYQVDLNDDEGTALSAPWPGYDAVDILGAFATMQRSIEDEHLYTLSQHDGANPAVGASTRTVQSPTLTLSSSVTGSSSVFTQHLQTSHENDPILQALQGARWNILERLSRITWISRNTAANVLDHPLARPIVPLLPPIVQAMSRNRTVVETMNDYDRATYYLARWGDREEQQQQGNNEDHFEDPDGLLSDMPEMQMSPPTHTRRHPVAAEEWVDLFDDFGRLRVTEDYIHGLIFRGGLDPDVRIEAWKFLLGIYPWDSAFDEREAIRRSKIDEYYEFKAKWFNNVEVRSTKEFQDEKHRIDKDVHRTDRSIEFFEGETLPNPDPDMTVGTNPNLEIMKDILVTYNFYNTELGYVQGMSDLLAPLFVAMGTEEMAFWGFVKFMDRVQSNFFKDQSGMHSQLQTLDALIRFMDPTLYRRLEETEAVNLFFCFRWLLVWFKREFEWEDVIRLWEVLWTDYLSPQMIMFIALAVIDKHRYAILNELHQFDEVLKYINELSGKIDLQETLERAEILFYQFERRVKAIDNKRKQLQERLELRSVWNSSERRQIKASLEKLTVDEKLRALLKHPQ